MSSSSILRLFTDFICPFCFIAEQSTVPRLLATYELDLDWCGFELHPETPRGGRELSTLFPGVDLASLHERTRRFAAQFGVSGIKPPDRIQSSRRALAVAEFARVNGRLEAFRAAAFEGHWRQSKNLESDVDLAALAVMADLDSDGALAAADDAVYLARVDTRQAQARSAGISGIPTFILGQAIIVGCQPYEILAQAAESAGARPRSASYPPVISEPWVSSCV
ncbi:MAG: DsbA family protein [Steroidobacteraceae bacterium]